LFFLILLHRLSLRWYLVSQIFSYKTSHELSVFLSIPLLIPKFLPLSSCMILLMNADQCNNKQLKTNLRTRGICK
jgi:hypothetical protein